MTDRTLLFWQLMGLWALLTLFAAFTLFVLTLRQRRVRTLLPRLLLLLVLYVFVQYVIDLVKPNPYYPEMAAGVSWLAALPKPATVGFLLGCGLLCLLQLRRLDRKEKNGVTAMSVKEAVDSLPTGLCFYLPGGRIVLVNRAMEDLCIAALGTTLVNGESFRRRLFEEEALVPGAALGREPEALLTLPDGSAWTLSESLAAYKDAPLYMLTASNVTELYRKNLSLRQMRRELAALNDRLTLYYREIVDLTTRKEVLDARVRLHDSLGGELLIIRHYLQNGGSEAERRALETRLRQSAGLLQAVQKPALRDEYALILDTAEKLRFHIVIDGPLPQTEPRKHIIATALHECLTNTLRHARGDALYLTLREGEDGLTAVFTNNGAQPEGPVQERGGLAALRKLTEEVGGTMEVVSQPVLTITLKLPKEEEHAL